MNNTFKADNFAYAQTGKYSKIVLDYVEKVSDLQEFYEHPVSIEGIKSAIDSRKKFPTNRALLVKELTLQYQNISSSDKVQENICAILDENTFTICTAHQPNLFTGHLYFIYKILHIIKLSVHLKTELPAYNFVPVFFMGSEDADLEELNHIVIDGQKYEWQTKQRGAVGRMKIDAALIKLIEQISGRLLVEEYGSEIVGMLKDCYKKDSTIEEATFLFIHALFKEYGLIVFLSDKASFKNEIRSIIKEDILLNSSSVIVANSSKKLAEKYKAQAYPRDINLFYLKDDLRNRIEAVNNGYRVVETDIFFTEESILKELENYPERFSPNVILRGLFQEFILPDVAWIGGGGELAYWLQLKDLFKHYGVPYPVLILRNSFMLIEKKYAELMNKLQLNTVDLFKEMMVLRKELVHKNSKVTLNLDAQKSEVRNLYFEISAIANEIDSTLTRHISALEAQQLKSISALEKKMFRAEKKKFEAQTNQLSKIFSNLFPEKGLQERTENFMLLYAKWGPGFMKLLYNNSLALEQKFCVIEQQASVSID